MAAGTDIYNRVFVGGDQDGPGVSDEGVVKLNDSDEAEERAQKVLKDIASAESAFNSWHGPAKEANRFYHGHQWDDIDRMRMESQKRPAITFNEIKPAVDAVSGLERLNRSDVRFVSRAIDANPMIDSAGDLASEAVATADDLCNGSEELSRVAKDAIVTGMGWAEIRMSYDEDINGRVVYERIPWEEMRWDPANQKKENLESREWCARKKPISRKLFKRLWGEDKLASVDLATPDVPYGTTDKYELVTPYYSRQNEQANPQVGNVPKKDIVVIQYQWRDLQPIYRFIDEDSGEESHLDEDQFQRLKDRAKILETQPPAAVKQLQPVYRQGMYARGVELEEPVDLPGGFSFMCLTGQWDENDKCWYGLVRPMIDPQKVQNKAISSSLAFHIANAKGGVLFKPKAFDDPRLAQDKWSQPDAWIPVTDDANIAQDIVSRVPTQLPPELPMFYQEANKAITSVSGVNEEIIGTATGQTPSQTAQGRTQASLVVLGWFFDNLKRHHREKAAMMLEFVREYWSQGQMIQVGGDYNSQAVPLLKEALPDKWHYSLVLDDSIRHNPNLKAQIWRDLMDSGVLQSLMRFGLGQVILKLLKFSPFPAQLVNEIQKDIAQNPPPPPKGKQQGGQGQSPKPGKPPDPPQLVAATTQLKQAQAQKALSQAREIDMRAGMSAPKLMLNAMAQSHQQNMDRAAHAHEQAKHGHQRNMDMANTVFKGIGSVGGLLGKQQQAMQPGQQQPPGNGQMPPNGGMVPEQ